MLPGKPSAPVLPTAFRKRLTRSSAAHELQDIQDGLLMSLHDASRGDSPPDGSYSLSARRYDESDNTHSSSNVDRASKARKGKNKKISQVDLVNQQPDFYNDTESNGDDATSNKNGEGLGNQPVLVLDDDSDSDSDSPLIATAPKVLRNAKLGGIAQRNRDKLLMDSRSVKEAIVFNVESESPERLDKTGGVGSISETGVLQFHTVQEGVKTDADDQDCMEVADPSVVEEAQVTGHINSASDTQSRDDSSAVTDAFTSSKCVVDGSEDVTAVPILHSFPDEFSYHLPSPPPSPLPSPLHSRLPTPLPSPRHSHLSSFLPSPLSISIPIIPLNDDSPLVIAKPTFRPTRKTPLTSSGSAPVSSSDTSIVCDISDVTTTKRSARIGSRVHLDSLNSSSSSSSSSSSAGRDSKRRRMGTEPLCSSSDATSLVSVHTHTTDASLEAQVQDPHVPTISDSDPVRSSDDCDGRDRSRVPEADQSCVMSGGCHEDGIDLTDDS